MTGTTPIRLGQIAVFATCLCIGVASLWAFRLGQKILASSKDTAFPPVRSAIDDERYVDPSIPNPKYSPRDVVLLQLESMRAAQADVWALRVCYSLATPGNRAVTGPFSKFSAMVNSPPYELLGRSSEVQVGSALTDDRFAAVLVTCLDESSRPYAFRFVLELVQQPPYQDCWMTASVQLEAMIGAEGKTSSTGVSDAENPP